MKLNGSCNDMHQKNSLMVKNLAIDGIMAALLFLVGLLKIPSFIPGTEFQLSAPYAVAIAKTGALPDIF